MCRQFEPSCSKFRVRRERGGSVLFPCSGLNGALTAGLHTKSETDVVGASHFRPRGAFLVAFPPVVHLSMMPSPRTWRKGPPPSLFRPLSVSPTMPFTSPLPARCRPRQGCPRVAAGADWPLLSRGLAAGRWEPQLERQNEQLHTRHGFVRPARF